MRRAARLGALLVLCALSLQVYFLARVALMIVVDPQSTTFQRSEIWRLRDREAPRPVDREWRPHARLGEPIKRAVIASEDARRRPHRRGVGTRSSRPGSATSAPRRERCASAAGPARPGGAGQGGRRLDDHPAAGEEPLSLGRSAT